MTRDKELKRRVRARAAETGETYTQARAALLEHRLDSVGTALGIRRIDGVPLDAPIFVSGHRGLVGSALMGALSRAGYSNLLVASREQLDLRDQAAVNYWFRANRPRYVFLVAGTVGGIAANASRPAEFLYDNLMIHATVVHASHLHDVEKLLYLGSSCIYPREAQQPITEDQLLAGPLEATNESYAVAKIAGVKLCQAYRRQYGDNFVSAMPTNLYGPGDSFHERDGHLAPMLMRRFHEAKLRGEDELVVWGTGSPRRELLHVDDLADACMFLMGEPASALGEAGFVNVGTGEDHTIADIASLIRDIVHPGGQLMFDTAQPDGTPRKLLDVTRLHQLGWRHRTDLADGLQATYEWFAQTDHVRGRPAASTTA
jgi:GDP-L-fucose synthase